MFQLIKQIWNDVWSNENVLGDYVDGDDVPYPKEKNKNYTLAEINEMMIARQNETLEQERFAIEVEAQKYFDDLYSMIVRGQFEIEGKEKRLVVMSKYEKPSSIKVGVVIQEMFKPSGYRVTDVNKNRVWRFGLWMDAVEGADSFFDSRFNTSELYRNG